jgi:hypothetical protein
MAQRTSRQVDDLINLITPGNLENIAKETKAQIDAIRDKNDEEKYIPLCLCKVVRWHGTQPYKVHYPKHQKSGRDYTLRRITAIEQQRRFGRNHRNYSNENRNKT